MAKKKISVDVDLRWTGDSVTTKIKGRNVTAYSDEIWSDTTALWTDDVITIIATYLWGGSRGGVRKEQDLWNAWDKIDNANRQKIVKVIVTLKDGSIAAHRVDLNEYQVTIDDLNLLLTAYERNILGEYEKYKMIIENVNII